MKEQGTCTQIIIRLLEKIQNLKAAILYLKILDKGKVRGTTRNLAKGFALPQSSFLNYLEILENCGLVRIRKSKKGLIIYPIDMFSINALQEGSNSAEEKKQKEKKKQDKHNEVKRTKWEDYVDIIRQTYMIYYYKQYGKTLCGNNPQCFGKLTKLARKTAEFFFNDNHKEKRDRKKDFLLSIAYAFYKGSVKPEYVLGSPEVLFAHMKEFARIYNSLPQDKKDKFAKIYNEIKEIFEKNLAKKMKGVRRDEEVISASS